jgi:hypothetical protein
MGVLNIQRNNLQPNPDNNTESLGTPRQSSVVLDWRILALLMTFGLIVWWFVLYMSYRQCEASYSYPCISFQLVLYLPLIGVAIFGSFYGYALYIGAMNKARKERLANMLYEHYDVDDASRVFPLSAQVAEQLARSEHLRGLDNLTYSGNNSGGNNARETSRPEPREPMSTNPLQGMAINIEDIFMDKEG